MCPSPKTRVAVSLDGTRLIRIAGGANWMRRASRFRIGTGGDAIDIAAAHPRGVTGDACADCSST
jgi:hypothetical protein